jgi:hypothetical protein
MHKAVDFCTYVALDNQAVDQNILINLHTMSAYNEQGSRKLPIKGTVGPH